MIYVAGWLREGLKLEGALFWGPMSWDISRKKKRGTRQSSKSTGKFTARAKRLDKGFAAPGSHPLSKVFPPAQRLRGPLGAGGGRNVWGLAACCM